MTRRISRVIFILLISLLLAACRGGADQERTTIVLATAEPTSTPLPPVETVPSLGSPGNPLVFLFVVEDAEASASLADDLTVALNENEEMTYLVSLTESYREAREALCSGAAVLVNLDPFSYLATGDLPCGQPVSVFQREGKTASQGQFIAADVFVPRVYRDEFCRIGPFSLDTWIMPRLFLLSEEVDPFLNLTELIDKEDDRAIIEAVLSGECGMGAISVGSEEINAGLPGINRLEVIKVLPAVPYDLLVRSDRLEGFALGLTEDLLRAHHEDLVALLGVEDLAPAEDLDLSELAAFIEAAGVDIVSLAR